MTTSSLRRTTARSLLLALPLLATPSSFAAGVGRLEGRVFQADGLTPRTDVVVRLVDATSESSYPSEPTRGDGGFRIERAPAGDYHLMIQTSEGSFVAPEPVRVRSEGNIPLALSLRSAGPNFQQTTGFGSAKGRSLAPWSKWLIVGVVSAGALLILDDLSNDEEENVSPFYAP